MALDILHWLKKVQIRLMWRDTSSVHVIIIIFFIDNSWKNVNVSYYSSLELLHHILWASICIFVKLRPLSSHRALVIRKLYCFENIVLTESFNITMATNYKHILCNIAMCTLCKNLDKVYKKATGLRSERMFTLEFRILWHY